MKSYVAVSVDFKQKLHASAAPVLVEISALFQNMVMVILERALVAGMQWMDVNYAIGFVEFMCCSA